MRKRPVVLCQVICPCLWFCWHFPISLADASAKQYERVERLYDILVKTTHNAFPVIYCSAMRQKYPHLGSLAGVINRRHLCVLLKRRVFSLAPPADLLAMGAGRNPLPAMPSGILTTNVATPRGQHMLTTTDETVSPEGKAAESVSIAVGHGGREGEQKGEYPGKRVITLERGSSHGDGQLVHPVATEGDEEGWEEEVEEEDEFEMRHTGEKKETEGEEEESPMERFPPPEGAADGPAPAIADSVSTPSSEPEIPSTASFSVIKKVEKETLPKMREPLGLESDQVGGIPPLRCTSGVTEPFPLSFVQDKVHQRLPGMLPPTPPALRWEDLESTYPRFPAPETIHLTEEEKYAPDNSWNPCDATTHAACFSGRATLTCALTWCLPPSLCISTPL